MPGGRWELSIGEFISGSGGRKTPARPASPVPAPPHHRRWQIRYSDHIWFHHQRRSDPPTHMSSSYGLRPLLDGDARNNERDCGRTLHPMGGQVGEVVDESKSGTSRDLGEPELSRVGDAVDLDLRDVAGSEIDVRVEQDVATLRFKPEAGTGTERDIHSTGPCVRFTVRMMPPRPRCWLIESCRPSQREPLRGQKQQEKPLKASPSNIARK